MRWRFTLLWIGRSNLRLSERSPIDNLFFVTSASSPPWGRGPRSNYGAYVASRLLDVDDLYSASLVPI
jgi:hypothetical protein